MEELKTLVAGVLGDLPAGDAPTPCRDWDVRALVGHLHQVIVARELAGRGEPVPSSHWSSPVDPPDLGALTWAVPPAVVTMGDMTLPGPMVAAMLDSDLVLHSWDLARAAGRDLRCPDAAAERTYRFVAETGQMGRSRGLYGDPVPVPPDAPFLDRAVALSGRDPAWSAQTP